MATSGTWIPGAFDGMSYYTLLPDGYSPAQSYPVLLFLHGGGQDTKVPGMLEPWFNSPAFRADYPAIVVAPVLSGASAGVTWGGFPSDGSTLTTNTPGETDALAILAQVMSQYSADPNRVYVTGLSLGGYATWDLMVKYNAYDGTLGHIFAAGMPLATGSYNETLAPAIISELQTVPIWAIDGDAGGAWDDAIRNYITKGVYHLTSMGVPGEDVWDYVYPMPNGTPYYNWMFGQSANAAPLLAVADITTVTTITVAPTSYSGPVPGPEEQYLNVTSDSLNIAAGSPNWFIHTGSGNDAVAVRSGTNVVDGGTGSNFLTGGNGTDTFFIDDRSPSADIWSTVSNFHGGDAVTIWGVAPQDFTLTWVDGQGANGFMGLTLHVTAAGAPTASLTLTGFSGTDLADGRVSVMFGTDAASGSAYMYIHANG